MDRYTEIAAKAFNKPVGSVTPDERRQAKDLEFWSHLWQLQAQPRLSRRPSQGVILDETSIVLDFDQMEARLASWLQSSARGDRR